MTLLILILSMSSLTAQALSPAETEAEGVLLRYFDALGQGDTRTMRAVLGGELLVTESALLDNPTYPAFLVGKFAGVRFTINRIETLSETEIAIEASMIFGEDDAVTRRYLLRRETTSSNAPGPFRIHGEQNPG